MTNVENAASAMVIKLSNRLGDRIVHEHSLFPLIVEYDREGHTIASLNFVLQVL